MTNESGTNPDQWVDQYGDYLFRYAYSRLRDNAAAEEVVQETFLAGIRNFEQFEGRGTERGWLLGILKRKIIDYVRRRAKHQATTPYEDHDPTAQLFDENGNWRPGTMPSSEGQQAVEASELWDIVKDCLGHLPQGQADVFMLSVMEEMDSEEICKELDISPSNYWVRLHRARLGLAKCVGSRWFENEKVTSHVE